VRTATTRSSACRAGDGEATGSGQSFALRAGQSGTFSGTDSLYADVEQLYGPDEFDNWSELPRSPLRLLAFVQYLSHDVVGYEDLDDYGDWRDDSNYGHVWFPNQVESVGRLITTGHWDWISPWGWTWVDDSPWGYAPVPLRTLGECRRTLGLGRRSGGGTGGLCARAGGLHRRRARAALAAMWDGSRWVRGKCMCRRTT
jgi:hypothetical protein